MDRLMDERLLGQPSSRYSCQGILINVLGMLASILGLQLTIGTLVAKTLTSASVSPFAIGGAGWNPIFALDVFHVQVPL